MTERWWVNSDNAVRVVGLRNQVSGEYINNAAVTGVLKDADGNVIIPSVAFVYVADSDGDYIGQIPAGTALVVGQVYRLYITAISSGLQLYIEVEREADYWTGQP